MDLTATIVAVNSLSVLIMKLVVQISYPYQCAECGCQWAEGGDLLRLGKGTYCRSAQRERNKQQETTTLPELPAELNQWAGLLSKSLWILVAVIAAAIMMLFGGAIIFRLLLPIALVAVGAYFLVRYGREKSWW